MLTMTYVKWMVSPVTPLIASLIPTEYLLKTNQNEQDEVWVTLLLPSSHHHTCKVDRSLKCAALGQRFPAAGLLTEGYIWQS